MGEWKGANKVSQPSGAHDFTYLGYITTGVGWGLGLYSTTRYYTI